MYNLETAHGQKETLLRINNVSRRFGKKQGIYGRPSKGVLALDGVNLDVFRGESLGIVGESGSGKTTLGRMLVSLDKPTNGVVLFEGHDINKLGKLSRVKFQQKIQMIFQNPFAALNPYRSVRSILESGYVAIGLKDRTAITLKIGKLLEKVGLNSSILDRYPHQFSGGQRQRIVIARALSVEPLVLVADEPVSALDVSIQAQVLNLLNDLRKELGLTIIFITHDLRVANFFCDRIAVMYLGRIVELGDTDIIVNNSAHPYTKMLMDAAPVGDPNIKTKKLVSLDDVETNSQTSLRMDGCSFADRCWLRQTIRNSERCFIEKPEIRELEKGHLVVCHYAEEIEVGFASFNSNDAAPK
jgi:oligopeptide transport system ATP-binding protein